MQRGRTLRISLVMSKLLAYWASIMTMLSAASDHPMLRAVPPGPYATNLTEAVQAHNQVWHHGIYTPYTVGSVHKQASNNRMKHGPHAK